MFGASHAGQPWYRLASLHTEYMSPGSKNMNHSTNSQRIEPFVYVTGSPCVPHREQTIMA
jgi:hypothetical protein